MKKLFALTVGLLLACVSAADAQLSFVTPSNDEARATRPPRARGPELGLAVEAAQTALAACEAQNYKVTALVLDSAAVPIVVLSDGAVITQSIAMGKAVSSVKNAMDSGDIAKQAQTDTALAAKLAADPQEGPQRPGGLVIKVGSDVIGAIAVSGTPSGNTDAACAKTGLDKVVSRLK